VRRSPSLARPANRRPRKFGQPVRSASNRGFLQGRKMKRTLSLALVLLTFSVLAAQDQTDPKDWTPIRIRGNQKAPEFGDIDTWLNSDALEMSKLKGKVVVVHFMAFG
jgi:hypothetical protein